MRSSAVTVVLALLASGSAFAQSAHERFLAWNARYREAPVGVERERLLPEGVALAKARRKALSGLIQTDPRTALTWLTRREQVPAEVAGELELPLEASGTFEVLAAYDARHRTTAVERWLRVGEQRLRVTAYGELTRLRTQKLHATGLSLDGWAALFDTGVPHSNVQASAYTTGLKKLLYMRVDFTDAPGDPVNATQANLAVQSLGQYYKDSSYDRTSITGTVTPTLRMPKSKAAYAQANDTSRLLQDARAAASQAGFDTSQYQLDVVAFSYVSAWGWSGLGFVGQKGAWVNGAFDADTMAHEIGHNYGLSHANFWQASGDTITGAGSSLEYGDPFEIMGSGSGQHNAWYKSSLDWFVGSEVTTATSSGTFRLVDLEVRSPGALHGLRVPISGARDYWVEYRPASGGNSDRGAIIRWGYPSPDSSDLLDMTPWTQTASDAALEIGRTFSDRTAGIHITPTGEVASSPTALDVVVNRGLFPTNHAPTVTLVPSTTAPALGASVTFTATAMDQDGDSLAYFWDFGDGTASTNQATQSRAYSSAKDVVARVVVSDMKGGTATATALVKWGTPGGFRVGGKVLEQGSGVEGVRVNAGSRFTFTDSQGNFTIAGVPQGSVAVTAVKPGYSFSPQFTNPVAVSAAVTGLTFNATRALFSISGKVSSAGVGLGGVTVSANQYSTVSSTAVGQEGQYTLTGIPAGAYVLSASGLPGQDFATVGFSNPVQVTNASLSGRDFAEKVVAVSGEVQGLAGPHTVTDGVRAPVQTTLSAGKWVFTLPKVPPGKWNLVATAPSQVITPAFANPVTVASAPVNGLIFNATAGDAYLVRGHLDEAGAPLLNANVTDGLRDSGTDSQGNYVLVGVPDGPWTLTPSKAGYQFSPASRAADVDGGDLLGQDFTVLNPNAPPIIAFPPHATPSPVPGTQTQLTVLGDDPIEGEAALIYRWSQTFGPAPAVIPAGNATNAAKTITVTFSRPGAYSFQVDIEDSGGLKATGHVTVLVLQTTSQVLVVPASATVEVDTDKQFLAEVRDQFDAGVDATTEAQWMVSGGGSISPSGKFTAMSVGDYTVSAEVDGLTGTSAVKVVVGPVPRVTGGPTVTPNPVVGATARASVIADDDNGEAKLTYTWSALNPVAAVTFAPNGSNAAKATTVTFRALGTYTLQVEVLDEAGLSTTGFVTVEVKAGLSAVVVTPANPHVQTGLSLQLSATGKDLAGADVPVTGCAWSAVGEGFVDAATGNFTAGSHAGSCTVTATCGGVNGSTVVTIDSVSGSGGGGGTSGGKGCGCAAGEGASMGWVLLALAALALRRPRATRAW